MVSLTHQLNDVPSSISLDLAYSLSSRVSEAFEYISLTQEVDSYLHYIRRLHPHVVCLKGIPPFLDFINPSLHLIAILPEDLSQTSGSI